MTIPENYYQIMINEQEVENNFGITKETFYILPMKNKEKYSVEDIYKMPGCYAKYSLAKSNLIAVLERFNIYDHNH